MSVVLVLGALLVSGCDARQHRPEPSPVATMTATAPVSETAPPAAPHNPAPQPTPPADVALEIPYNTPLAMPAPGLVSDRMDADGWPHDAIGPLVVYERLADRQELTERGENYIMTGVVRTAIEVVTYDLGAEEEVASFVVASRNQPRIDLAGRRVLVNFGETLWSFALDGSGGSELIVVDGYIERLHVSQDGSRIALNHCEEFCGHGDPNDIVVLDVESGNVVLTYDASTAPDGFVGVLGPDRWMPDGSALVLAGWTYTDAPGGIARLTLDGDLEIIEHQRDYNRDIDYRGVRPSIVHEGGNRGCAIAGYNGVARIVLRDPLTNEVMNQIEDEWPVFGWGERSPDGQEVLLSRHQLTAELAEAIMDGYADGGCPARAVAEQSWQKPREWLVLPVDGSAPFMVADRGEAYARWLGDRVVSFVCGDEEATAGSLSALRPESFDRQECYQEEIEIRIGGWSVGAGRQPDILGFIDAP